ncbi:hypothetical protein HDU87_005514 [Geranomyces variabilis]|uniref:ABC transporter domain-containing protein n=1 Tax=Geranomyces variabilis TaxID=109894 RepID=A0AAD5TJ55_9FUNG|nr:hypothetical protein HDU87_005514 [Geranomyces variabilis]
MLRSTAALCRKNFLVRTTPRSALASQLCVILVTPFLVIGFVIYLFTQNSAEAVDINSSVVLTPASWTAKYPVSSFGPLAYVSQDQAAGGASAATIIASMGLPDNAVRAFTTAEDMNGYCQHNDCLAGVVFNASAPLQYSFLVADKARLEAQLQGTQNPTITPPELIIDVQANIERALADLQIPARAATHRAATIQFKQLESSNIRQLIFSFMEQWIGGMLACAFLPLVFSLVSSIVAEKETKIREGMLMMNLSRLAYNLSWLVTYAVLYIPVYIACGAVLKAAIYTTTSIGITVLWFASTACSVIAMCFVIEVFLSSARSAGLTAVGALLVLGIFEMILNAKSYGSLSGTARLALSTISPFGFIFMHTLICIKEESYDGVSFSTWTVPVDGVSFAQYFGVTCATIPLYLLLAWYLSQVIPGQYGVTLPFYFPFSPSYWSGTSEEPFDSPAPVSHRAFVENITQNATVGMDIRQLRKVYPGTRGRDPHVALDSLSLQAYEGQALALLGKNGAGKSTLISILTNLIPASSGEALIRGRSIHHGRKRGETAEDTIGICPQHDVLWPNLTVRQHLELFAAIKGVPVRKVASAVEETIRMCDLVEKADYLAGALSGGQKRRLSTGIAYVGGSRTIILDEPTSGLDPKARRAIWDIIGKNKQGRTVLFTTHFMDEAEQLGDLVAILGSGRLEAAGSPAFLKKSFGVGYTLVVQLQPEAPAWRISDLIVSSIPNTIVVSQVLGEATYRLHASDAHRVPDLLLDLETIGKSYGVASYGLSITSLEDVFIKIATEAELRIKEPTTRQRLDSAATVEETAIEMDQLIPEEEPWSGVPAAPDGSSFFTQVSILTRKLALLAVREPLMLVCRVALPVAAAVLAAILLRNMHITCDLDPIIPPLQLTTDLIPGPLYVSPSDDLVHQAAPTLSTVALDAAAFRSAIESSKNISAALQITSQAQPWDGSYLVAQGDMDGEALWASATVNLATNMYLAANGAPATQRVAASFGRFPSPRVAQQLDGSALGAVVLFLTCFAILPALAAVPIIRERANKSKHQQLVSGASRWAYWLSFATWDLFLSVTVSLLCTIVFAAANTPSMRGNFGWLLPTFILYSTSSTMLAYAFSTRFDTPAGAVGGLIAFMVIIPVFFLQFLYGQILFEASTTSTIILRSVMSAYNPGAGLGYNIVAITNWAAIRCPGDPGSLGDSVAAATWPVLLTQAAQTVVFFLLAVGTDLWSVVARKLGPRNPALHSSLGTDGHDDVDVQNEKARILNGQGRGDDVIAVKNLRKEYFSVDKGASKIAVKDLTLGVGLGECMVLLGPNGAGKTSTFSILAGDQDPSSGDCVVDGYSVIENLDGVQRSIGVTPQFDALVPNLTVREHLDMYARIKGVPSRQVPDAVRGLIEALDLVPHAHKRVQDLSGGNQRKVSLAIAVAGSPRALLLDEPTTSMDPVSKRFMWKVISRLSRQHAVLMTTHSMEEAEALASKVGIMTAGRLRCLGTTQHLRERFGHGYLINVRVKDWSGNADSALSTVAAGQQLAPHVALENVLGFLQQTYTGAYVTEQHGHHARVLVPRESVTALSQIFAQLEHRRDEFSIQEYTVSHVSLEEVFLAFARASEQASPTANNNASSSSPSVLSTFRESAAMHPADALFANILFATIGGGAVMAVIYVATALLAGMLIVGLPSAALLLRRAKFVLMPYGHLPPITTVNRRPSSIGWLRSSLRWIFTLLTAPFLILFHLFIAGALAVTIVFYPFAKLHFRLCALALYAGQQQKPLPQMPPITTTTTTTTTTNTATFGQGGYAASGLGEWTNSHRTSSEVGLVSDARAYSRRVSDEGC